MENRNSSGDENEVLACYAAAINKTGPGTSNSGNGGSDRGGTSSLEGSAGKRQSKKE